MPVATFEVAAGGGLGTVRHLFADHQGSIVAIGDGAGAIQSINRYDEYGIPAATNSGRFQYTGQVWLAELGMYYYKARIYSPTLGRFLQTDPIGYEGGINIYGYVGNDPVNVTDPSGKDAPCNYTRSGCDGLIDFNIIVNFAQGAASYATDVATSLQYAIDGTGLSGREAQNRATLVGQLADRGFGYMRRHPSEVLNRIAHLIGNNKAYAAGRFGTGAAVSALGGPVFGGAMSFLSGSGGAIRALNGLVSQLEAGNINSRSLSSSTVSTVTVFGVMGASINFNARTGDITARMSVTPTGSRISQTRTAVICNVNSRTGC